MKRAPPISLLILFEDTAQLERMVETEVPPDEYYQLLRQDMAVRHPAVSPHVVGHLVSLGGLLDVAIISGLSSGAEKARICVTEGFPSWRHR